jgi:hypothetical protein
MTESKVVVRYGCDGCGRLYDKEDDLFKVQVMQWRGRGGTGTPFYQSERLELLCPDCLYHRQQKQARYE